MSIPKTMSLAMFGKAPNHAAGERKSAPEYGAKAWTRFARLKGVAMPRNKPGRKERASAPAGPSEGRPEKWDATTDNAPGLRHKGIRRNTPIPNNAADRPARSIPRRREARFFPESAKPFFQASWIIIKAIPNVAVREYSMQAAAAANAAQKIRHRSAAIAHKSMASGSSAKTSPWKSLHNGKSTAGCRQTPASPIQKPARRARILSMARPVCLNTAAREAASACSATMASAPRPQSMMGDSAANRGSKCCAKRTSAKPAGSVDTNPRPRAQLAMA